MLKPALLITAVAMFMVLAAPAAHAQAEPKSNQFWWPDQLDLKPLRQHSDASNPLGADFNYAEEFQTLDLDALKKDIEMLMTESQDWWPADYGHYGPFFIRMAWHSAGVYRVADGRGGAAGGQQRFEPLNSWPDNVNLDKARRLLWPIKQKYGRKISWADLMVLTGNVALESMGFETFGFAGGRRDDWEADLVYWGPENEFLADERYEGDRKLQQGLAAVQMGLIYVNPEGPNGVPDPLLAANDIRDTFGRMAMNDEETVALIAGGHTFGKAHGARKPPECVGPEPAAAAIEEQGFGWNNKCGTGKGADTTSSGLEGAWSVKSDCLDYTVPLDNLFNFEWVQTRSPAGAVQWIPADNAAANLVPDAQDSGKRHAPIMFTTDLSLKFDPAYREISLRFKNNPEEYAMAFAKAWFKLTHRDMGPVTRYLGSDVPSETLIWQDPLPDADYKMVSKRDISRLKNLISKSGLTNQELIRTAWASAASYRGTDMRGGANGARVRLAPQNGWAVNSPAALADVLTKLEVIQSRFNDGLRGKKVSLVTSLSWVAQLLLNKLRKRLVTTLMFRLQREELTRARFKQTLAHLPCLNLRPMASRNYFGEGNYRSPAEMLVDRANMLTLTVPEMTVLVGGMRALDGNTGGAKHGVFTDRPGTLTNDFFVNLLDMSTKWSKSKSEDGVYEGRDRKNGALKWTATPVDLIFGSHSELRAVAEVYASADADKKFVTDFVDAWTKVMNLDRFDMN